MARLVSQLRVLAFALLATAALARQPNFIVILLDDLDATQDSSGRLAMPATNRLLRDKGVTFTHHFVSTSICCPSRVNLLRGQLTHNTNFTYVLAPHGGYAKFRALELDREWLPVWLQRAGYNTLYTGKFLVDYTILNRSPSPAGFTVFDALVHPFTFEYYCPAFSRDGGEPLMYPAQYVTDVVGSKARALLRSAATDPAGRPFYLQVAPPAPHHSMHYDYNSTGDLVAVHDYPPLPAARHWEELSGAPLPRHPNFNDHDLRGKPAWVRALERLTPANISHVEEVFRLRLRSLRAVDEIVEDLVTELTTLGLLDSTYILFTSDNGYHQGARRMGGGKTTAYEEDLRVPLVMAGPGLLPGSVISATTQHIDIAPTVLALAGAPLPPCLDGTPLPLAAVSDGTTGLPASYVYGSPQGGPLRNQMVAEYWGIWQDESIHSHPVYRDNTWRAVRVLRSDQVEAYKYILHCTGEVELYDLVRDPYERINLLTAVPLASGPGAAVDSGVPDALAAWAHTAWAAVTSATARSLTEAGFDTGSDEASADERPTTEREPLAAAAAPAASEAAKVAEVAADEAVSTQGQVAEEAAMAPVYGRWLGRIRSRLEALLAVLAVCTGQVCVRPFEVLHPGGEVHDLWTAMDEKYDDLYDKIQPFRFGSCLRYQDIDNEYSQFRGAVLPGGDSSCNGSLATRATQLPTQEADVTRGSFKLLPAEDVEEAAVPLPAKYWRITDLYGSNAVTDQIRLA